MRVYLELQSYDVLTQNHHVGLNWRLLPRKLLFLASNFDTRWKPISSVPIRGNFAKNNTVWLHWKLRRFTMDTHTHTHTHTHTTHWTDDGRQWAIGAKINSLDDSLATYSMSFTIDTVNWEEPPIGLYTRQNTVVIYSPFIKLSGWHLSLKSIYREVTD